MSTREAADNAREQQPSTAAHVVLEVDAAGIAADSTQRPASNGTTPAPSASAPQATSSRAGWSIPGASLLYSMGEWR